jgi:hypothetical protein
VCDPDADPVLRRDADAFGATLLAENSSESLLAALAA